MKYIVLLSLYMLVTVSVKAQSGDMGDLYFRHLDSHVGLYGNASIYSIVQDNRGFIWIATNRGLVRFDGSSTTLFNKDNANNSTIGVVFSIQTDIAERLWLKTSDGIKILDYNIGVLKDFNPFNKDEKNWDINNFEIQSNGKMLFTSGNEMYECDTLTKKVTKLPSGLEGDSHRFAPIYLSDRQGVVWLGYPNRGIYKLDKNKGPQFVGANAHTPIKFYDYDKDSLMICTLNRGVWIMCKSSGKSRKLNVPDMPDSNIFAKVCCKIDDNQWWIGTETGIYIMHNGNISQHLKHVEGDVLSLSDDHIISMCLDSSCGIWVGTEKGGVNYCKPKDMKIRRVYPSRHSLLKGHHVTSFAEGLEGDLWIGTDDGGLCCVNNSNIFDGYYEKKIPDVLKNIKVTDLLKRNDELWISTYAGGIFVMNLHTMQTINYKKNESSASLKNNEDNCLCMDSKGRIWIGSTTDLFMFDDDTHSFVPIDGLTSWITDIVADKNDNIWAATRGNGLLCYNMKKKRITWFHHKNDSISSICKGRLSCLYMDQNQNLWIGSDEDGLCYMDTKSGKCRQIRHQEGLPEGIVCRIMEDNDGKMWISTSEGLALLNKDTFKVQNIWKNGFWPVEGDFSPRAGLIMRNGELCWGGTDGFICFFPQIMADSENKYTPIATQLYFPMFSEDEEYNFIKGNIIELPYDHSTFGVRFSALDYESGNGGLFEYRLTGSRSSGWMRCMEQNVGQWSDLPPGEYILYARYASNGSTWSDDKSLLTIKILPPWWRSWWAYLIYSIIGLGVAVYLWHIMKKRRYAKLLRQQNEWEDRKKEETMEARIKFFTNVAHEIRTPVSLIRASVEQIVNGENKENNLKRLSRNTESLGKLVDQLLEFRRVESGVKKVGRAKVNLTEIIKLIFDAFHPSIQKNKLKLIDNTSDKTVVVWGDVDALNTVMTNLMSNAVKYAKSIISVNIECIENNVVVKFWNDGEPIPESIRNHVFELFVKGEENENSTGIGLSIVHILLKRMGGDISMITGEDGTMFCVNLQLAESEEHTFENNENTILSDDDMVMIVEDNDDMRSYLHEQFSKNYKVVSARNGHEAWKILENNDVVLIVSDVMMPEMDGFQLCGKVKSTLTTCHIPVLLLTAKTTESEHVTGYNLGADAYIDKPFSINELTAVAYSLIRNRQLQRRRFKLSETNRIELENDSSLKEDYNWMNTLDRDFNKHLNLYINDHLSDEDFNIDSLAENLNMSRSNLHRKMKALFDTTPGEYVHVIRLKQAANMLATGEYRVGEVCMMVGFHSVAHFSRAFLKHYGMSPKTYIKTQRKNN